MGHISADLQKSIINDNTIVHWFRRDLRLEDNAGLYYALRENTNVLGLFIFDTALLNQLEDIEDQRVEFIYQALMLLKEELEKLGTSLLVLHGDPCEIFKQINPKSVYTNHDYEVYATNRDETVKNILASRNTAFKTYKDQVIFEKSEITKENGEAYSIFTPYSKKWKANLNKFYLKPYPTQKYYANFKKVLAFPFPSLKEIGFKKTNKEFPPRVIKTSIIKQYDKQRNFPSLPGTSRLSVHLRFGTVSIRKLATIAQKMNKIWLNELIWRDFYQMILWHFPRVVSKAFKAPYDKIEWKNDPQDFDNWCTGSTGYPIVDAGMRELNETGFMHNRVRMIVASFLTKHLLIDWRWGEAYFAKKLIDFELASNNGGWQWAAGSGCDAAPYFRIFNPELQTEKFDKDHRYIKKWIPEFGTDKYPKPIIDHKFARDRAIKTYQKALQGQ